MIIIILGIIIICILYWLYKNPIYKKHDYWDIQPVSRNHTVQGIISVNFPKEIDPSSLDPLLTLKPFNVHNSFVLNEVTEFINSNYIYKYYYTPEYIKWCVLSPNSNLKSHSLLYYNNKLVGTIISRSMDIIFDGTQIPLYYVDFLCIHKEYRKKNWATVLISNTVTKCTNSVYRSFIFKIEKYPLPFNYVSQLHYYYKDISNYKSKYVDMINWKDFKIKRTSIQTLTETYRFFNSHTKKYRIYPFFSKLEFMYYFVPSSKIGSCLELRDKNNILYGIMYYTINNFKTNQKIETIADIQYIFVDDHSKLLPFIDKCIAQMNIDKFKYVSITNNMNNMFIIKSFGFSKSMKFYYQMYNYHCNGIIPEKQIALNIP